MRNKTNALILLVLTFLACSCERTAVTHLHLEPGEQLPRFTVRLLDGGNVSTTDLFGKPSLIVFFSTTCPDCHRQLPEVESAYAMAGEGAAFIVIARDEGPETVGKHWTENGYTIPVSAPGDRTVYDLFDRGSHSGIPLLFISDAQGVVRHTADDSAVLTAQEMTRILSNIK